MERYDYLEAIKEDVLNYINENNIVVTSENRDEVEQDLNDTLFAYFAQVETRYRAIKNCPFTPAHVVKVFGGYMCFESDNDYRVWRNQK